MWNDLQVECWGIANVLFEIQQLLIFQISRNPIAELQLKLYWSFKWEGIPGCSSMNRGGTVSLYESWRAASRVDNGQPTNQPDSSWSLSNPTAIHDHAIWFDETSLRPSPCPRKVVGVDRIRHKIEPSLMQSASSLWWLCINVPTRIPFAIPLDARRSENSALKIPHHSDRKIVKVALPRSRFPPLPIFLFSLASFAKHLSAADFVGITDYIKAPSCSNIFPIAQPPQKHTTAQLYQQDPGLPCQLHLPSFHHEIPLKMFATKALRQASAAAAHAERTPLIKFLGKRTIPSMSLYPNNILLIVHN